MKVLILGDSPFIKTGFGRVNEHALRAFLGAGFEVASVTALQTKPAETDLPVKVYTPESYDEMGGTIALKAIEEFKPDVVYATGDPGNAGFYAAIMPEGLPFVGYIPIEGEPLVHSGWREILSQIDFFTCSKYGTEVVWRGLGRTIDYVYHGVDSQTFTPLSTEERDQYRKRLGWDDKFVIACVAQNVRRKQLPRLIEAVAILKHHFKQRDIILYLHSVPFQNNWLDGWNLSDVATAYGVYDEVVFNPLLVARGASVPEIGNIDVPGVRELLGSSDLFALFSQVEGFCLPIVESFAVGLPVITTKYAAGWEIAKLGGGVGVEPHDWEVHKSGTRYGNVDPLHAAKEILRLKRSPKQLATMRLAGLDAIRYFDWSHYEKLVVERVARAAETKAKPVPVIEAIDQAPSTNEESQIPDHETTASSQSSESGG